MVRCRDATVSYLSPKFGAKSSHNFTKSPWNATTVCGIDSLAYQNKFFLNNPLDIKENYEHALDFALRLSPFSICREPSMPFKHPCTAHAVSPNACLIIVRVSVALFPRLARNLMHTRCRIHREITSGQIHDCKWKDNTSPRNYG
jgi:hypothetical protein